MFVVIKLFYVKHYMIHEYPVNKFEIFMRC